MEQKLDSYEEKISSTNQTWDEVDLVERHSIFALTVEETDSIANL